MKEVFPDQALVGPDYFYGVFDLCGRAAVGQRKRFDLLYIVKGNRAHIASLHEQG